MNSWTLPIRCNDVTCLAEGKIMPEGIVNARSRRYDELYTQNSDS